MVSERGGRGLETNTHAIWTSVSLVLRLVSNHVSMDRYEIPRLSFYFCEGRLTLIFPPERVLGGLQ
jgi:hypothetical protein